MNKIIYSLRVMVALVEAGFTPESAIPNPKYPNYNCWVFKRSEAFDRKLNEILGGMKYES